jgi:hypothetical protein
MRRQRLGSNSVRGGVWRGLGGKAAEAGVSCRHQCNGNISRAVQDARISSAC